MLTHMRVLFKGLLFLAFGLLASACGAATPIPQPTSTATVPPLFTLESSNPPSGASIPLKPVLAYTFSQPLDPAAARAAFHMQGEDGQPVPGEITFPDARTLRFAPNAPLQSDATYRVRLDATLKAASGQTIAQALHFTYVTEAPLAVAKVIPADGSENISPTTPITVVFNKPVVPLTARENTHAAPDPLVISPKTPGHGRWVSSAIYIFQPDAAWKGDTTYTAAVRKGFTAMNGEALAEAYVWQFTTEAVRLRDVLIDDRWVSPDEVLSYARRDAAIALYFSSAMNTQSVEQAITITSDNGAPSPPLTFRWNDDATTLTIIPQAYYAKDTTYRLTIAAEAQAKDGSPLEPPPAVVFHTAGAPQVLRTYPENNTGQSSFEASVDVYFNTYLDSHSLEGHIEISPALENLQWSVYGRALTIYGFEPATTYTITLLPGIADVYGETLQQPYTFRITTAPLSSQGDLLLPYNGVAMFHANNEQRLWLRYANLNGVTLRLYRITDQQLIQAAENYYSDDCPTAQSQLVGTLSPERLVKNDVRQTRYLAVSLAEMHGGNPLPPGPYCLEARFGAVTTKVYSQHAWLVVATDNLAVETSTSITLAWATDLAHGTPQPGLPVAFYTENGTAWGQAAPTNADGVTLRENSPENSTVPRFAIVHTAKHYAFTDLANGITNTSISSYYGLNAPPPNTAYIYTDRPLYRPGQTVYFKGLVRRENDMHYSLPQATTVWVSLWHEDKLFSEQRLPLSTFGTFHGSVTLPEGAPVGNYVWRIRLTPKGDAIGYGSLRVAAYHKPLFQVELTADQPGLHAGESTTVHLAASYYAGDAVANGQAQWEVRSSTFYFQPPRKYSDYIFQQASESWWWREPGAENEAVAPSTPPQQATLDAHGRYDIPITAPEDADHDLQITVWATVTDESGNTAAGHTTLTVRQSDVYIGVKTGSWLGVSGEPLNMHFVALTPAGQPLADQPFVVTIAEEKWHSVQKRDASGVLQWENTLETTPVAEFPVTRTGKDGTATLTFTPDHSGTYRITVRTADAAGRPRTASTRVWVTGKEGILWMHEEHELPIVPDKSDYRPGETAHLLMPQPFDEPTYALFTVARGTIYEYRVIRLDQPNNLIDLPIEGYMAPEIYASVLTVRGSEGHLPDYQFGTVNLPVALDQQTLNVTVTPDKTTLPPGETLNVTITTRTTDGKPVPAEVSLAVVDKAIYALAADNFDLLQRLYHQAWLEMAVGMGLTADVEDYNARLERWVPEGPAMGSGGGGKGADTQGVIDLRESFRDTAYWQADIQTDAEGRAHVSIPLPDNLTTWVLTARGITADTRVGKATAEVTVSQPFFVRLHTPAFFTGGDHAVLQAVLHNTTDQPLTATVRLAQADGLSLESPATQQAEVPAQGQTVVRWEADVPLTSTRVDLQVEATAGNYRDASRPLLTTLPNGGIPVYQFTTREHIGTAGILTSAQQIVEYVQPPAAASHAALRVELAGSLLAGLPATLESATPPEGKYPALWAATVETNAAVWQAYQALGSTPYNADQLAAIIRQGVQALEAMQDFRGGWGWCPHSDTSPLITAHVVQALLEARAAGFPVDDHTLQQASDYLNAAIGNADPPTTPWQRETLAFEVAVAARLGTHNALSAAIYRLTRRLSPDDISTAGVAYLLMAAETLDMSTEYTQPLTAQLEARMARAAAGIHWDGCCLHTDTATTALALEALLNTPTSLESDLALAARWLMIHRKGGVWGSAFDDATVVRALAHWATHTHEAQPNYDYRVAFGDHPPTEGHMDAQHVAFPLNLQWEAGFAAGQPTPLVIQRGAGEGALYYDAYLELTLPAADLPARDDGIALTRAYYRLDDLDTPTTTFGVGDIVQVRLEVVAPHSLNNVVLTDYLPAGLEAVAFGQNEPLSSRDDFLRYGWGGWYFSREFYDERVVFGAEHLPAGVYTLVYYARAAVPGEFQARPATIYEAFFPDVAGRSAGAKIGVR